MKEALSESLIKIWHTFHDRLLHLIPRLLAVGVVIVAGWLLAALLRLGLRRVLHLVRFDERCEHSGLSLLLHRAELRGAPSEMLAQIVFWAVSLSSAVFSLSALEVPALDRMVAEFFLYLPRVFVAMAVVAGGFLLANFLGRTALLLAVNEELPAPRLVAGTVRLLVNILALAMALEQLGIARNTVSVAFAIAFGAVMLALALAFGLGGRDLASELLRRRMMQGGAEEDERDHL